MDVYNPNFYCTIEQNVNIYCVSLSGHQGVKAILTGNNALPGNSVAEPRRLTSALH